MLSIHFSSGVSQPRGSNIQNMVELDSYKLFPDQLREQHISFKEY